MNLDKTLARLEHDLHVAEWRREVIEMWDRAKTREQLIDACYATLAIAMVPGEMTELDRRQVLYLLELLEAPVADDELRMMLRQAGSQ